MTIFSLNLAENYQPINELYQTADHPVLSLKVSIQNGGSQRRVNSAAFGSPRGKPARNTRHLTWRGGRGDASKQPGRYRTSQAAAQGTPRCAGAACPRTAAVTAGAAPTGGLQPSTDIATNNIIHVSIQPPASQRPAANRTQDVYSKEKSHQYCSYQQLINIY
jgi:hypothetical protein